MPIQDLLSRIRWDPGYGAARFTIGYYDRIRGRVVRVPLERIDFEPGNHFFFNAVEADGSVHEVPFHRVREVLRDGALVWQREPRGQAAPGAG